MGELRSESETVELGGAAPVRIEIEMDAGELDVSGGVAELLDSRTATNRNGVKGV